ncbi:hypothetical protein KUCAC02_027089 [Chaenocephalus aceratus]|uniref:Uncharacterized protein n=1 Tax=Chaenocephalus aceratus TaxID=36190 RepID=A0ACB9W2N5_CHAAC|nr:hypothetical protein KUCAC02_027089 [Chaenocephalus aceratus]
MFTHQWCTLKALWGPLEEQKDIKQQRLEVLSKIEKLFMVLLEQKKRRVMEKSQGKVEHIYSQLQHHSTLDSGVEFLPFLLVSKGKRLLARLLPFLKNNAALKILSIVTSNLPALMGRDPEEALPVLYPPLRKVIGGLAFSQLIGVLKELTTYESLTLACQNKFGLSLLAPASVTLRHGRTPSSRWRDSCPSLLWWSRCSCPPLLTLFCRYLDKRTVHQLKSNMESATGYLALAS